MLLEEKILARLSLHGFFNSKIADDKCLCPSIFQEAKHVIKNLTTDIPGTLQVLIDKQKKEIYCASVQVRI